MMNLTLILTSFQETQFMREKIMWINLAGRGKGFKKFGSFDIADIAFNMSIARRDQLEEKDTDRNKKYKTQ